MDEQTQNAFSDESNGDAAPRGRAVTAAGSPCDPYHPFAAYESGRFVIRPPAPAEVPAPAPAPAPPPPGPDHPPAAQPAAGEADSAPPPLPALPSSAALPAAGPPAPAADEVATFEPIPLRARHDGWTPDRQRQFLDELADCGLVGEAAARVGMTRQSAYQLRRRAEGTAFGFAWEAAVLAGMRRIHSIAFERAVEGVAKPIFYHGEKVGEHRTYDTRLLLGLVSRFGNAWSGNRVHEVEKDWESWLEAVEQGRPEPAPDMERSLDGDGPVWMDADGIWWTAYPPPDGALVEEHGEWGDEEYQRMLTDEEEAAVEAAREERRIRALAERDAFFARAK